MDWLWLQLVAAIVPAVLSVIPKAAPLGPIVTVAIQTAEAMRGASSTDKLAHAQQLIVTGAAAANVAAGHTLVDPAIADQVAAEAISTIVDTANIIHRAHAAPA